jgi:phosphoribosylanthranilate isomerase
MATKMLKRITVTGADDSVTDIEKLLETSREYPLVEWGILISRSSMGHPRYPSLEWLDKLATMYYKNPNVLNLSAHICGRWVREIFFEGKTEVFDVVPMDIFKRVQFNFHANEHKVDRDALHDILRTKFSKYDLIFQFDGVNNSLIEYATMCGLRAFPLFDKSGGAGILPDEWPIAEGYSGYAGGLSPENVVGELEKIDKARDGYPIWIDAETYLRSEDNSVFELDKVRAFVKNSYPWTSTECIGCKDCNRYEMYHISPYDPPGLLCHVCSRGIADFIAKNETPKWCPRGLKNKISGVLKEYEGKALTEDIIDQIKLKLGEFF